MKYRDNVCAVIRRKSDNSVLIFHRKGCPETKGWQFPQGGIDVNKDLIWELKRELLEEIGTDDVAIIAISRRVYTYKFPKGASIKHKGYSGQKQRWVLIELKRDESVISFKNEDAEFDAYQWVSPKRAIVGVVNFKKAVYKQGLKDLGLF